VCREIRFVIVLCESQKGHSDRLSGKSAEFLLLYLTAYIHTYMHFTDKKIHTHTHTHTHSILRDVTAQISNVFYRSFRAKKSVFGCCTVVTLRARGSTALTCPSG